MSTVVRLYLGWRVFRLVRPFVVAAFIASALIAVRAGHVAARHSPASALQGGVAAVEHGLPRAFERAFKGSSR